MWLLSCDEYKIFSGERRLCLPGQTYTIGRGAKDTGAVEGNTHAVDGRRGVSRRHLVISIAPVKPGDGLNLFVRSKVTVTDESKLGTVVDHISEQQKGRRLEKQSMVLDKDEHTFLLGHNTYAFRLKWEPQVITFINPSNSKNRDKNLMAKWQAKVEKYDVKTIEAFVHRQTKYVCADKRNTAKGLQALVNGAQIVLGSYVDAIAAVCGRENPEINSPAELDFDKNWPDPINFLPPPSSEPVHRPAGIFAPDPRRQNMMEGYVVFATTRSQHRSLLPCLTDAGGKLELFEVVEDESDVTSLVRLVNKHRKRIVLRTPSLDSNHWYTAFFDEVARKTNLVPIEQNELLDAILTVDVESLCKPFIQDDNIDTQAQLKAPPPTAESNRQTQGLTLNGSKKDELSSSPEPVLPRTNPIKRTQSSFTRTSQPYVSKIRDDDDDEDFEPLPPPKSSKTQTQSSKNGGLSSTQATFANGRSTQLMPETQTISRKRSIVDLQEDAEGEDQQDAEGEEQEVQSRVDETSSKRRRIAGHDDTQSNKTAKNAKSDKGKEKVGSTTKPKIRHPEPIAEEVLKKARTVRQQEEEAAAAEQQANKEATEDMYRNIAKFKNMAIVETFEVKPRTDRPVPRSLAYGDEGARWDERWNGRKNFKKFKRRAAGTDSQMRRMAAPLVVSLVEHKEKDFGLGDGYWEGSGSKNKSNKSLAETHVSQTQFDIPNTSHSSRRTQLRTSIPENVSRSTRQTQTQPQSQTQVDITQTQDASPFTTRTSKRVSQSQAHENEPAPKKQKTGKKSNPIFVIEDDQSDDDEDELKFRF